jgi:hypothetical protein
MNGPSSAALSESKVIHPSDKDPSNLVTINEKVNLTKNQQEILQMVCNSYQNEHFRIHARSTN